MIDLTFYLIMSEDMVLYAGRVEIPSSDFVYHYVTFDDNFFQTMPGLSQFQIYYIPI